MPNERKPGAMRPYNPEDTRKFKRDFFIYESESLALVAGVSSNDTIQIEADSDFILQKLTCHTTLADATYVLQNTPIPNVSLLITDTGSGRQLMNNPIPIPSFFGNGQLPFILPNPRKIAKNSVLNIAYTNFDAAQAYSVRLAFIGYKIYELA